MAKKSRRNKKKQPLDWSKIGRASLRASSVLLLVLLAIGLTFGVDRLRTHAGGHMRLMSNEHQNGTADTHFGSAIEISFEWPILAGNSGETWPPKRDQEELLRVAQSTIKSDAPLSVEPLRRLSAELGKTGWFSANPTIRRTARGKMVVDGEWRIPAAVVRWDGRDHLVSSDAMPMPPEYEISSSAYPFVAGVFGGPSLRRPARYMKKWPGPGVSVGLDLIAVLRAGGMHGKFAGVDVARYYQSGGPIEIVSPDGNRVVWGSPVDEWTPGEPTVEEKMTRLHQLVDRTGLIDAGQQRIEIHRARVEIDRTGED